MIVDLLNKDCHHPLTKGDYFIYDDDTNKKIDYVDEDGKWNLKIANDSINVVNLFQNDGCLMTENNLKKCDWIAIFKNDFYFIEAKDVKSTRRKKQRNDAIEKFDITIPYYIENYPSIIDMNFYVIMNFRSKTKLTRAANKAKAFYFKEEFNADYIETNYLDFN